jgi:pimeloyl-ACP methyl ester carboxylesterase
MSKVLIITVAVIVLIAAAGAWLWTPDLSRQRLETAYLRAPSDMIEIAGAQLHVRADGPESAPAVILIHGFGSSLHTFEGWAQGLQSDFQVIRIDLPGSGLSPPDPTGRYDDGRAFELLDALMAHYGLERASLVGNSVGGRIAWSYAAEYPDRVDRLVLVAPDGFASTGFEYDEAPEVGAVTNIMRFVLPRFLVRMNLVQSYGDPERLEDQTVQRYYDLLRAPGARQALIARMEQTILRDPRPRLPGITAPTLLVWGEKDGLIPVANAQDYLGLLPDARLETFDDLGHLPQEEAPERSLVPVKAFLSAGQDAG